MSLKVIDVERDEDDRGRQHGVGDTEAGRQDFWLKTCTDDLSAKGCKGHLLCGSQGQGNGLYYSIPERMWTFMMLVH